MIYLRVCDVNHIVHRLSTEDKTMRTTTKTPTDTICFAFSSPFSVSISFAFEAFKLKEEQN